jgi:hypothetical protein
LVASMAPTGNAQATTAQRLPVAKDPETTQDEPRQKKHRFKLSRHPLQEPPPSDGTNGPRLEDGLETPSIPTSSREALRVVARLRKKEATYMVGDASKPGQRTATRFQTGGQTKHEARCNNNRWDTVTLGRGLNRSRTEKAGWIRNRPPARKLTKC